MSRASELVYRSLPPRPLPIPQRRLGRIARALAREYGSPRLGNKNDPLDELIYIVLSARTSDRLYRRTYDALHREFPDWSGMAESRRGAIAKVIREGGLSRTKEGQLRGIIEDLAERDALNLRTILGPMSDMRAEAFLVSLPGVGKKTARCVLMYSLRRKVFPVDTHVARILGRIGGGPRLRLDDSLQDTIQRQIPPDLRYDLHVDLVAHGRAICLAVGPKCGSCCIRSDCAYYRERSARVLRSRLRNTPDSTDRSRENGRGQCPKPPARRALSSASTEAAR